MTDVILKEPCIIDISHWETVDWNNLDNRVVGVIMKATQGKFYLDPTFSSSWAGTRSKKLPASAYHFFEPNDVSSQVANYLTACEDVGLIVSGKWVAEIEPVLDAEYSPAVGASSALIEPTRFEGGGLRRVERNSLDLKFPSLYLRRNSRLNDRSGKTINFSVPAALTPSQLASQYKAFLDMVESEVGIKPIIYTSNWRWAEAGNPAWSNQYKLWTAQYPYDPNGQTDPKYFPFSGWTEWFLWQYDEEFVMNGIGGKVDVNVFNGTIEEWKTLYGGEIITPPPPEETNMEVKANFNITIRENHSTSAGVKGTLASGQTRTVLEQPWETGTTKGVDYEQWVKIAEGWVAVWYRSSGTNGQLCTLTGTLPPEPPVGDVAVSVVVNGTSAFSQTYPPGTEIVIKVL